MRAAAIAACSNGDGVNAERQWNIRVGRGALRARLVANEIVRGTQRGKQRRVRAQFPAGSAAEQIYFELELPPRTIARGFHLITHARGDALAQRGFESRKFVIALRADVDLETGFVRDRING